MEFELQKSYMTFPQEIPVWEKGYITFDFRHQHGDKIIKIRKKRDHYWSQDPKRLELKTLPTAGKGRKTATNQLQGKNSILFSAVITKSQIRNPSLVDV